jgi:hypothetical protein
LPLIGLAGISGMNGLYRQTKVRLRLRNVAIVVACALVGLCLARADTAGIAGIADGSAAAAAALVLAVLLTRRLPSAAVSQLLPTSPAPGVPPPSLPLPNWVVDVAPLSAAARRLCWLTASVRLGAFFLVVAVLAPEDGRHALWAGIVAALVGMLIVLGVALTMEEDRLRPASGLWLALGLLVVVGFAAVGLGGMNGADAARGVVAWSILPLIFFWRYRRQRRSLGLTDAQVQAASRIGLLPAPPPGRAVRLPSAVLWLRVGAAAACAWPVAYLGLVNSLAGTPVLSDFIESALEKLNGLIRGSIAALLVSPYPAKLTIAMAESAEPAAWRLRVRSNLIFWGKLGPPRVAFEEFLHNRLGVYGAVQPISGREAESAEPGEGADSGGDALPDRAPALAVMPAGVALREGVFGKTCALASRIPLLVVLAPVGTRPIQWSALAEQLQTRGVAVPALAYPNNTIAVLHLETGENAVYLAPERTQWAYVAAIQAAFEAVAARPSPPGASG